MWCYVQDICRLVHFLLSSLLYIWNRKLLVFHETFRQCVKECVWRLVAPSSLTNLKRRYQIRIDIFGVAYISGSKVNKDPDAAIGLSASTACPVRLVLRLIHCWDFWSCLQIWQWKKNHITLPFNLGLELGYPLTVEICSVPCPEMRQPKFIPFAYVYVHVCLWTYTLTNIMLWIDVCTICSSFPYVFGSLC